jgi:hypothetical protein
MVDYCSFVASAQGKRHPDRANVARALEIDPKYTDTAIARPTDRDALHERDGTCLLRCVEQRADIVS